MKTITYAKLSKYELATIIFAARWQMQDWKNATPTDTWDSAIAATKYLERYIKDFPQDSYLIRTGEQEIEL